MTWKKRLAELLKEHKGIGEKVTGQIEINLNLSGICKIYKITKTVKGDSIIYTKKEIK